MSLFEHIKIILDDNDMPFEVGVYSGVAPDTYMVGVPLNETFDIMADNKPEVNIQEMRLSLFTKGNYLETAENITNALLVSDITITGRGYVTYETSTGYHHYYIDVADYNLMEEI